MKLVGRMTKGKRGFSEELNRFFQLIVEFRKDTTFMPRGVFRFKSFEEAEKWQHKMLRNRLPDHQQ